MAEKDHDLLIRVDENVRQLTNIVTDKFNDHESRLRMAEKELNTARGGIKILYATLTILIAALAALAYWR